MIVFENIKTITQVDTKHKKASRSESGMTQSAEPTKRDEGDDEHGGHGNEKKERKLVHSPLRGRRIPSVILKTRSQDHITSLRKTNQAHKR